MASTLRLGLGGLAGALLLLASGSAIGEAGPLAASAYQQAVLADGPVGYWRLDETAGVQAADLSGQATTGSYQGGALLGVPGALVGDAGVAVRLDGVNDLVSLGDPASGVLDFGSASFTAEAWVRTSVNGESVVFGKRPASGPFWQVTVTDDSGYAGRARATLYDGSAYLETYSAGRIDDGAWHHLVALFDRAQGPLLYVDGSAGSRATGASPGLIASTAALQLGKTTGYAYLNGDLDEVALYPTLLSPTRIQEHQRIGRGQAPPPSDTTPPTLSLTAPANGSSSSDTTPTFAGLAGSASGDLDTITIRVYPGTSASGSPSQTLTTTKTSNNSYSVDATTPLSSGTYTAQASQQDSSGNTGQSSPTTFTITATPPPSPSDPRVLAAGDIAGCVGSTGEARTAAILDLYPTATVAALGDLTYPDGTPAEFTSCYDPTWGRAKERTRPAIGDHEYRTPGAAGYFGYWGTAAGAPGQGWYSYDLGSWHVVVLNTRCEDLVGSCDSDSPQAQWLRADLAAHQSLCTLAYWHAPRFSSGTVHGGSSRSQVFWDILYQYGAELTLGGNEHHYERFAPQTPTGAADPARGIREFVVGTGGYYLYGFGTPQPNSEVRYNGSYGVLKLTLHPSGYEWEYLAESGAAFTDSGSNDCH